ncbi:MAG TPA: dihydroneopterin triphosphate diphosphatase [Sedimenticola thiotaurini]|uniref:Dihydroneopterin triphosphate diphosphatase n=1 Tax=Sedimenticola thiotaurini TaxID=1543721 RepID=A0A831RR03_9GAMM|nr:dihydroneopterin triphosphate diphosphatase [Sedimenticola thiotaurini]
MPRGGGVGIGTGREDHPPCKRPESVLVVVHTRGGEVLMLRRTAPAGFWQSVTGSLRRGESPRHAAERELFEETGLRAGGRLVDCRRRVRFPIVRAWRSRYAPGVRFNLEHQFRLELPRRRLIRLNPDEHREYRWLPRQRAARLASSWTNREAIQRLPL